MTKIIFCGDRHWRDKVIIRKVMDELLHAFPDLVVIEGEAKGADKLSREVAIFLNVTFEKYPANWDKFGLGAGPIRNTQMLVEGKAEGVIAFHNNLSQSKGTRNMVEQAQKAGLPVWVSTDTPIFLEAFIYQVRRSKEFKK